MKLWSYLIDKIAVLLIHLAGVFSLCLFLALSGTSQSTIILISGVWLVVFIAWMVYDYRNRKRTFDRLFSQLEKLEKPYLIAEVMESSPRLVDRLYREALRQSGRSISETIHELEDGKREYKEYIEHWIHEVKIPLTGAKLICENEAGEQSKRLMVQLDRIEKMVEQVLFYARMENAYKDYFIHEVDLREVVCSAIAANKVYFIQKGIQIQLEISEEQQIMVPTDEKWVVFLLTQIFSNAIKYAREENPTVRIYAKCGEKQVSLVIEDDGVGIASEDLPRIYEKGFTGKNGRQEKRATGIGLYLCKGLCDKLGLGIHCESQEGSYTRMTLIFPNSHFMKPLEEDKEESYENVRL